MRKTKLTKELENPFVKSKNINKITYRLISITSLISLFLVGHQPILNQYGKWLRPVDLDPSADMAVVVDGSISRIESAILLLKENKVQGVYVNAIPKAKFNQLIEKHKMPPEKFYWGGCLLFTTFDQPIAFREGLKKYNLSPRSLVLVTNTYHLRRSLWTYQFILNKSSLNLNVKTHESIEKQIIYDNWWNDKYSRDWVSSETQKLIFYWLNYGILNKFEKKDMSDIEFSDVFRKDETTYDPKTIIQNCRNDPY